MRVELWRGGRAGRFIWYRLLEERKKVLRQGVQRVGKIWVSRYNGIRSQTFAKSRKVIKEKKERGFRNVNNEIDNYFLIYISFISKE